VLGPTSGVGQYLALDLDLRDKVFDSRKSSVTCVDRLCLFCISHRINQLNPCVGSPNAADTVKSLPSDLFYDGRHPTTGQPTKAAINNMTTSVARASVGTFAILLT
jgi:hypothetical protein